MSEIKTWDGLARDYGPRAVLDLHISDGEIEEITADQAAYVVPLLMKLIKPHDAVCLDYGCGAGRWAKHLVKIFTKVIGYDPSEMLKFAPTIDHVTFTNTLPTEPVDVVFCWVVAGGLENDVTDAIQCMTSMIKPGGLMIFADHMEHPGRETWWHFRPMQFYATLFDSLGIVMRRVGHTRQLANGVTILAGRK